MPKIWVLVDHRVGNANQAIMLANRIGCPFEIKRIDYNWFGGLPNVVLSWSLFHVKNTSLTPLVNRPLPDIIISAGRRTAAVSIYLKRLSKNKIKLIQIMRPNLPYQEFDLIILPQHDAYNNVFPNIVRTIGALTDIQDALPKMKQSFEQRYPDMGKFIAVVIGGSTKGYSLTMQNAQELSRILHTISTYHSLDLFITFSRRTPISVKQYFQKRFLWPHVCYDPSSGLTNPYPAILGSAEFIIVTADSISMCSEAASTGTPVYIYCPENFNLKKHNFFIQQLVDLGIVQILDRDSNYLLSYNYSPLSEIDKVVKIIKNNIL